MEAARAWFEIDQVVGVVPVSEQVGGRPIAGGLVARVGGRERVVALSNAGTWVPNVPSVTGDGSAFHTPTELDDARRELAAHGYGIDLRLEPVTEGRAGIIGVVETGGVLRRDSYGALYELPRPDGPRVEVRWAGRDWVGGYVAPGTGEWSPALPVRVDGNEPIFAGDVMLTADDCHDPDLTREFMELVDELGVPATFYPNTPNVELYPDEWVAIAQGRHEIGFHTTLHLAGYWTEDYLEEDLTYFEGVVRETTGVAAYRTTTVRPPFGMWDYGGWEPWVTSKGLTSAMWGRVVGVDASPETIERHLDEHGALILLMHPEPDDLVWFRHNRAYLADLTAQYTFRTVTGALLRDAIPIEREGLPA